MSTSVNNARWLAVAVLVVLLVGPGCAANAGEQARPGFCDPGDRALNDGHGPAFQSIYDEDKGPLSTEDCSALGALLGDAEAFARRYPTVSEARRAGWVQIASYVDGQGVHFEAPGGSGGPFDPRRPKFLLYDGARSESRLAGMMFLEAGDSPPEGFPGDNDHWHNHPHLCFNEARTFVLGEHMSMAECADRGGVMIDSSHLWMVHVWLPVYDGWEAADIFDRRHPSL